MRVLAIDPGFDRMGIAVLERQNGKDTLLYSACATTNKKEEFGERLRFMTAEFRAAVAAWKPDMVALEKLFFSKNQKTAMRVAEARGVILGAAAEEKVPVREFPPNQIKLAVTGDGSADKIQVARMVRLQVKLLHEPKHDDEIDAIAIGIACLAMANYPQA